MAPVDSVPQAEATGRGATPWLRAWTRAVIIPASRRADAAWVGCGIVASVVFGPTAMRPSDLTGLALHNPGVGLALTAIWLLVFLPTARLIVRPRAAAYLESLPGAPRTALAISAAALLVLQLPWLALWLAGEGLLGGAIVLAITAGIALLARWQPTPARPRPPTWSRSAAALRGTLLRALRRRAGDALLRGAGLAVLAGLAGGLIARNNQLTGAPAATLASAVIAVVLVPAQIGPTLVMITAYHETTWLAESLGVPPRTRLGATISSVALVHATAAAIATCAAMVVAGPNAWLPPLALATALGTALNETRTIIDTVPRPSIATRVVVRAIVAAAVAVICLLVLDAPGVLAFLAIATFALLARPR